MTDAQRLAYLKAGAIAVVGLFLLDRIVISPAIDRWGEQTDRINALRQKVERGRQLLDRRDSIRNRWTEMMRANLPPEVSAAEGVAYQAIGRWVSASGITFSSLAPDRSRRRVPDLRVPRDGQRHPGLAGPVHL